MRKILLMALLVSASTMTITNLQAEDIPRHHCVSPSSPNLAFRFKLIDGHNLYANTGSKQLSSSAPYELLEYYNNGKYVKRNICFDAKKLLANRRNVKFQIDVKSSFDCKKWHVKGDGSTHFKGTQYYKAQNIFINSFICVTTDS